MVKKYRGQDYTKLQTEATRSGQLFTDPLFPANSQSLGLSTNQDIEWKRPSDICDNPKLVVNGVTTTDLNQGVLGNCWFVAACSCLASELKLWEKVIPHWKKQEWDSAHPEKYGGIFHFHFWRQGELVDVVIDDLLPTRYGELVYMKSQDKNEFWSALLEKAYAKLAGSYEALTGGQTGDALVDFTGGVNEPISMKDGYENDDDKKKALFEKMMNAQKHKALISCSIALSEGDAPEKTLDCGLIKGHAYAVTALKEIKLHSGLLSSLGRSSDKLMMLKLRNPWGRKEWNGAWSDQSPEWKKISSRERDSMDMKVDDDGDFWMELHDWVHWFTDVSICRQVNTSLLSLQKTWHEAVFHGEWKGQSAGGSVNNRETFLKNPQYVFKVPQGESEVMLSLMQQDPRSSSLNSVGGKNFPIGFYIMKVEENREYKLHEVQERVGTITFTNRRSVFGLFTLKPGAYAVVPSTFEPNQERPFILRIFSERPHHAKELKEDTPTRGLLQSLFFCFYKKPRDLVTVHLHNAHDLKKQDLTGAGADPYCIVKCGGDSAETPVIKNTLNPTFETKVMFYISDPSTADITVQVWNHNLVVDSFMGQIVVPVPGDGQNQQTTESLKGRGRQSSAQTQGTLSISASCSSNLFSS